MGTVEFQQPTWAFPVRTEGMERGKIFKYVWSMGGHRWWAEWAVAHPRFEICLGLPLFCCVELSPVGIFFCFLLVHSFWLDSLARSVRWTERGKEDQRAWPWCPCLRPNPRRRFAPFTEPPRRTLPLTGSPPPRFPPPAAAAPWTPPRPAAGRRSLAARRSARRSAINIKQRHCRSCCVQHNSRYCLYFS
jgi:hypothetical protein